MRGKKSMHPLRSSSRSRRCRRASHTRLISCRESTGEDDVQARNLGVCCHHLAAILSSHGHRHDIPCKRLIDTEAKPSKNAILQQIVAQKHIVEEWICCCCLLEKDVVSRILHQVLAVAGIGGHLLDTVNEILVEEDLTDMRDLAVPDCVVCLGGRVKVADEVDMRCSTFVVSWEECLELDDAILIGLLGATEIGSVEVGEVGNADAVDSGNGTRVDSSRVGI